ncbi:MAG: hypothetical protein HQL56_15275 [Magnetococcales bacterium]|nr:hypothetical protein [Magnetococcales bacterium]
MAEISADFNIDVDQEALQRHPETRKLREAIDSFAVWLVHGQNKAV